MNQPALTFDEATHTYKVGGVEVPHVTEITSYLASYAGVPFGVLEKARERGQAVHYATELYDQGVPDINSVPDAVLPYLKAWIAFRDDTGFTPFEDGIETKVWSPTYRYAGTVDRAGTFASLKRVAPSVGCLIACSAEADVPAAVKAFFALCRGTGVVTLGWAGSTASARFTGGGHAVSGRTAKVTAQWTVLSDWT